MDFNKNYINNERSPEVDKIIKHIPSKIYIIGYASMIVIIIILVLSSIFIKWPESEYLTFKLKYEPKGEPQITLSIPSYDVDLFLKYPDKEIVLYSDLFPQNYKNLTAKIYKISTHPDKDGNYEAHLKFDSKNLLINIESPLDIVGKASFIKQESPIIKIILYNLITKFINND